MPLTSINIELTNTNPDRWQAEVEVGGLIAKREVVRAGDFHGIMAEVARAYYAMQPAPIVPRAEQVARTVAAVAAQAPRSIASEGRVRQIPAEEVRAATDGSHDQGAKDELVAEALALGLDIDRRWGAPRLRAAIALAKTGSPRANASDGQVGTPITGPLPGVQASLEAKSDAKKWSDGALAVLNEGREPTKDDAAAE